MGYIDRFAGRVGESVRIVHTPTNITDEALIIADRGVRVQLPSARLNRGERITIMHRAHSGTTTVIPIGGNTINGERSWSLGIKYAMMEVVSDGVNEWLIVMNNCATATVALGKSDATVPQDAAVTVALGKKDATGSQDATVSQDAVVLGTRDAIPLENAADAKDVTRTSRPSEAPSIQIALMKRNTVSEPFPSIQHVVTVDEPEIIERRRSRRLEQKLKDT